jgi:integrase
MFVAIQTGLRVSELIELNCGDVALGTGAHVRLETRTETPSGCRGSGTPADTFARQHETPYDQGVSWFCCLNLACARRDSNP